MKKNEPIVPATANKHEIITDMNEIIQSESAFNAEMITSLLFGSGNFELINALHHKTPQVTIIAVQMVAKIEDIKFIFLIITKQNKKLKKKEI